MLAYRNWSGHTCTDFYCLAESIISFDCSQKRTLTPTCMLNTFHRTKCRFLQLISHKPCLISPVSELYISAYLFKSLALLDLWFKLGDVVWVDRNEWNVSLPKCTMLSKSIGTFVCVCVCHQDVCDKSSIFQLLFLGILKIGGFKQKVLSSKLCISSRYEYLEMKAHNY